jgi:hypothetical protein
MPWERIEIGSVARSGAKVGDFARPFRPPKGPPVYSAEPMVVQVLDTNSTAITISNSPTETVIANVTIPALTLSSTGGVRLTAAGWVQNTAITGGTARWRVKIDDGTNQTVLATSSIDCSTSANLRRWQLEAIVMGKQPTYQRNWGFLNVSSPSTNTFSPLGTSVVGYSTSNRDETKQITMTITAQLSASSTGFSLAREAAFLEGLA